MIANHIHDALGQVRRLQELILEKRKFTGYSGTMRMLGGSVAMLGTIIMSCYATSASMHLLGWTAILATALVLNYGALFLWLFQLPETESKFRNFAPALDAVPPLAVGAVLSLALVMNGNTNLLFGTWMCLYGLSHTSCRSILPKKNWYLGFYYLLAGAAFLLLPDISFLTPWPAGLIFLVGEWYGGHVFHQYKAEVMEDYNA